MPRRSEQAELRDLAADYAVRVGRALAEGGGEVTGHPLVGVFAVEHDGDGQRLRSGRVDSVVGASALVLLFSALDGCPTSIHPVRLSDLTSGSWTLYRSYRRFREEGALYYERYYDREFDRAPRPRCDVLRDMWAMDVAIECGHLTERQRDRLLSKIMDGEDPLEVLRGAR